MAAARGASSAVTKIADKAAEELLFGGEGEVHGGSPGGMGYFSAGCEVKLYGMIRVE